jgi:hypothetical protein
MVLHFTSRISSLVGYVYTLIDLLLNWLVVVLVVM